MSLQLQNIFIFSPPQLLLLLLQILPRWLSGKWIHLPMQETQEMWVLSLGQENPLEQKVASHSSIFAEIIPWTMNLLGYSPLSHKESDTREHTYASCYSNTAFKLHYLLHTCSHINLRSQCSISALTSFYLLSLPYPLSFLFVSDCILHDIIITHITSLLGCILHQYLAK